MTAATLDPKKGSIILTFNRSALEELVGLINKAEIPPPDYPGYRLELSGEEAAPGQGYMQSIVYARTLDDGQPISLCTGRRNCTDEAWDQGYAAGLETGKADAVLEE